MNGQTTARSRTVILFLLFFFLSNSASGSSFTETRSFGNNLAGGKMVRVRGSSSSGLNMNGLLPGDKDRVGILPRQKTGRGAEFSKGTQEPQVEKGSGCQKSKTDKNADHRDSDKISSFWGCNEEDDEILDDRNEKLDETDDSIQNKVGKDDKEDKDGKDDTIFPAEVNSSPPTMARLNETSAPTTVTPASLPPTSKPTTLPTETFTMETRGTCTDMPSNKDPDSAAATTLPSSSYWIRTNVQYQSAIASTKSIQDSLEALNEPMSLWVADCQDEAVEYLFRNESEERKLQDPWLDNIQPQQKSTDVEIAFSALDSWTSLGGTCLAASAIYFGTQITPSPRIISFLL
jgi:hypothetical protein